MGYYDHVENVEEYVAMAEGYDGRELVAALREYLRAGASVLELGMGPGKDLKLLNEHFCATGSDSSAVFLDRFRQEDPAAGLLLLDAVTLETDRQFDALYSNKVLRHLTEPQLAESFRRQALILRSRGILLHSFWYGDQVEEHSGLLFVHHTEDSLGQAIGDRYDLLESKRYTEIDPDDSLYVVLRKRT